MKWRWKLKGKIPVIRNIIAFLILALALCRTFGMFPERAKLQENAVETTQAGFLGSLFDAFLDSGGDASYEDYWNDSGETIDEDGEYTSKEDVALYIYTFEKLPSNFITKKEAKKLGWEGGKLEPYAPGKSIGGDRFGNYEGTLPEKKGRTYKECDIDTLGKKRGAKRIVYSSDGLIYYTEDHYETFELLYGEE